MSYDLCIWHGTRAVSAKEADEIFGALCEARALPPTAGVTDSPAVGAFLAALSAQYPDLDTLPEEAAADSPWSFGFVHSGRHVELYISFSAPDEVMQTVLTLAAEHGLVVYDPQGPSVYLPPALRTARTRWRFWR